MRSIYPTLIRDFIDFLDKYVFTNMLDKKKVKYKRYKNYKIYGCLETKEIYVGHGNVIDRAELLKKRIEEELKVPVRIEVIGPIVGTTCGPGVIATFCRGKEVTRYEGDGIK